MSLDMLDSESEQLYTELKGIVKENAAKVARTLDALVRIRDGRLYRAEFKTFDAFCQSIGKNTRGVYRLLEDKAKKPKRIAAQKPVTDPVPGTAEYDEETELMQEAEEAMSHVPLVSTEAGSPLTATEIRHSMSQLKPPLEAVSESVNDRLNTMMEKLSIKPVIDVRAEQYRTHTPIPAMDRLEDGGSFPATDPRNPATLKDRQEYIAGEILQSKAIASTELKAWAEKRRATNDATSEDDAAWACYIAQQIML